MSVVPVEAARTMCPASSSLRAADRAADTARYAEFLMQDTLVMDQHTSYQLEILHLVMVIKRPKPKGLGFKADFLELNMLTDWELAKIWADCHIPNSVVMQILKLLEALSNPKGEVVFFADMFNCGLRLPLRTSIQLILAQICYPPCQFNPNFWFTLLPSRPLLSAFSSPPKE
ncbi:hypothetical protein L3X38_004720 [Prunus dulcis]|uniref:Uncharacterized protein n=1 Tax=Prunus dulcis TaxID=3755 RepID=A0AAD5F3G2_PRUDU|nr:hypothetical protein L3X38_004720 [Prunus dulcis]